MYYSGIDLHSDNCYITTVGDTDVVIKQQRVENIPELVVDYFQLLPGPHSAVVESTTGWYWLNDLLEANGIELVLAHAKYLKAITYAKVKTDKVDSHTLATLLRLVHKRTACSLSLHSIGVKFNHPDTLPEPYQLQVSLFREQIQMLTDHILTLEKSLHPTLIPNDDIQHLLYVPGIGKLSAFTLYLEIDGIERFCTDKHFVSNCRLVPAADNSNRRVHHRSSKDGNKYLKIAFSDIAVHAIQYYPEFRAFYQKRLRRSNPVIARTPVAKELAKIVYYILKNKTSYQGFKGQPISRQKSLQWPRLSSPDF
jgi:transposase